MKNDGYTYCNRGTRIPLVKTWSLQSGLSPAMLPSAQTACSWTSMNSELSSLMNMGTAPASMTIRVWCDVPLAIFVNAHAASNWKFYFSLSLFIHEIWKKYYYSLIIICRNELFKNNSFSHLESAVGVVFEEFDEFRDDASLNDFIYRRIWFSGQQFPELLSRCELFVFVGAVQGLNHIWCDYSLLLKEILSLIVIKNSIFKIRLNLVYIFKTEATTDVTFTIEGVGAE